MSSLSPEVSAKPSDKKERPTFTSPIQEMQFDMLVDMITQRNSLVGKVNAATGDRQTLTEQIRENSQDPEIVALREQISQLVLDLDALVKPQVEEIVQNSAGSVDEFTAEIKKIDEALKPGMTYYKKLFTDGSHESLPTQERVKGAVIGGGGGRRIRGFNLDITLDGETTGFENFSSAAKYLGDIDTSDLQKKFFEAAGTEKQADLPDDVKFSITIEEVDEDENVTTKTANVHAFKTEAQKAKDAEKAGKSEEPKVEASPEPAVIEGFEAEVNPDLL